MPLRIVGAEGTAVAQLVRFTMDRNGNVLAVQLQKSSGYEDLDQEAVTLIHRAQPLPPPPPPEVPGNTLELVVPVRFFMHGD